MLRKPRKMTHTPVFENKTSMDKNKGKIDNDMFLFIIVLFLSIDVLWLHVVGTAFQTAVPYFCYYPVTSSRVTLASLGIAFQAKLAVQLIGE